MSPPTGPCAMTAIDKIVTLPYLAARDYIHGTTVFEVFAGCLPPGAVGTADFRCSQVIKQDVCRIISRGLEEQPEPTLGAPSFRLVFRSADTGKATFLGIYPQYANPETAREAFDEGIVRDQTSIQGNVATFIGQSPYSFVKDVVVLYKTLLDSALPEVSQLGKWKFARLDLAGLPGNYTEMRLIQEQVIGRGQLTRASIHLDGKLQGSIYFSIT